MSGTDPARESELPLPVNPGLCGHCVHARRLASGRGPVYLLCQLGLTDPAFPKYPRLPVLQCAGYEAGDATSG
jgi:hypothetical protein